MIRGSFSFCFLLFRFPPKMYMIISFYKGFEKTKILAPYICLMLVEIHPTIQFSWSLGSLAKSCMWSISLTFYLFTFAWHYLFMTRHKMAFCVQQHYFLASFIFPHPVSYTIKNPNLEVLLVKAFERKLTIFYFNV